MTTRFDSSRFHWFRQHSPMRELLLLGLVFIIVVSGISFGFYFIVKSNQVAAAHLQAATSTTTSGATPTLTATLGAPILEDSLSSNTNGRWPENATCLFKGGTYHVLVPQAGSVSFCSLKTFTFDNVAIQVDISLLSGSSAGFFFRFKGNLEYIFQITSQPSRSFSFASLNQTKDNLLMLGVQSNALSPGSAKNTVLLIANGSDFKLYINNVLVGKAQDSTSSTGQFGFLAATNASTLSAEGSFSNLKVFRLR